MNAWYGAAMSADSNSKNADKIAILPLTDSQGFQQFGVNPSGNQQPLRRLEPANCLAAGRANHSVNSAMVIAALGKFRLH